MSTVFGPTFGGGADAPHPVAPSIATPVVQSGGVSVSDGLAPSKIATPAACSDGALRVWKSTITTVESE